LTAGVQETARRFVRDEIDPEYLRRMDRDEIRYPRELYELYAKHQLLGLRFPKQYGGQGMDWVAECAAMGEVGSLGMAGARLRVEHELVHDWPPLAAPESHGDFRSLAGSRGSSRPWRHGGQSLRISPERK
jgi:alkylation response protein AidB-like acyl-CoA dehydrogenase